ncbi:MAG: SMP-30/gluconolactonase/LRE family protein [Tannerella sp.]|jgi:gluconolactonase|nr:SMP-30/gluconolactonase/LRE family protein [Tannerella sp.]
MRISILTILLSACLPATSQNPVKALADGAEVRLLADGFAFTEGPAADKDGNVYFTDQPNDKILKWNVNEQKLSVFSDKTGRANGLFFDQEDNLLSCSDMDNEMWKWSANGNHKTLITNYDNKKLNGPNDLWVAPSGGIYFTDPLYPRNYWTRDKAMQQDGQHVYYITPDYKHVIRIAADLKQPNGIIGTPDGKRLYVADIGAGKTYVYDIQPDATLSDKRLFCEMGSDGMTIDRNGNIYLTGRGVTVFNPSGEKIAHIPVKAKWTANVCFGGANGNTLFITASEFLYSIDL